MSAAAKSFLLRESIVAAVLLLIGALLVPVAVYQTGMLIFGEYGGGTMGDFLARFYADLGSGGALWLLVLAPYLAYLLLRLGLWGIRRRSPA